jgi:zinc-dependent metalloproteinase lipoprotein
MLKKMQKNLPARRKLFFLLLLLSVVFKVQSQIFHQQIKRQQLPRSHSRANIISSERSGNDGIVRCATMEADAELRKKYPAIPAPELIENELQKKINEYKREMQKSRTEATVYTIPVIVHIIHSGQAVGVGPNITSAQVKSQIDVLNEDFRRKAGTPGFNSNAVGADVEVEFVLALRDPQGKTLAEAGIDRINGGRATWDTMEDIENTLKPKTQWDPNRYLNMWTVQYGGEMSKLLGYAQFPVLSGLPGLEDKNAGLASTDGLVMRYTAFGRTGYVDAPYDKGRTTTHEIGHWLGLRHIWGDKAGCSGTDYCSDTPTAAGPNYGCKNGINSCDGEGSDMVENYMDYSDDGCMNIFTIEQKNRIRTVMQKCPRRKELLNSPVHLPDNSGKPFAGFSVSQNEICAGTTITFTDQSTNNPSSWKWIITDSESKEVASSTLKNPSFTLNTAGVYGVTLIVSNGKGESRLDQPNYITVLSGSGIDLPFEENFEENEVLPGWSVYNPDNDREWYLTDEIGAGNSGSSSIYFDNYSEDTDPTGTEDAIISPGINLSTFKNAELSFDVAYAVYEDEDGLYSDTLIVYYSTDCGKTYKPFWKKWGKDLATASTTEDSFEPSASEWRREKISLAFLNGQSGVNIAISNKSGWGNNLYLDNIDIDAITSTDAPIAAFNTATLKICAGEIVQYTDNSSNNPTSWKWTFPGGTPSTSTEQNPSVTYRTAGTYSVTLTVSNNKGSNTKSSANYIAVYAKPQLKISASSESICDGDSVVLTASGGKDYVWKDQARGGELGRGASITVKPNFTNTYIVEGKNESNCTAFSSYDINVKTSTQRPVVSISNGTTGFVLTSSSLTGNQWFLNGKPIPGATSQTLTVTGTGAYSVMVSDGSCARLSESVSITGNGDLPSTSKTINIYPIPTSSEIIIESIDSYSRITKVTIFNTLGMKLDERDFNKQADSWRVKFDVSAYPQGTYVVIVKDANKVERRTFIKL